MDARDLQGMIEKARGPYRVGQPMDAKVDQDVLVGIIDGLGGGKPRPTDSDAWQAGIRIGREIAKALKSESR